MEIKPGIKTTEFWISVLTPLGTVALALGFNLDVEEMVAVVAPFVAYILSRGWAKSGTPPVEPPLSTSRRL